LKKLTETILKLENVSKRFGNLIANEDVKFHINKEEIVSLIGPNGAGKTTLFNCITGFYEPEGKVIYKGEDITGYKPYTIAKLGLSRTFQIVKTIKEMTVKENIMTGAFLRTNKRSKAEEKAEEIMNFTGLYNKREQLGGSLTIADKKRLEIARVLATSPEMLMLDEAMAGLNQTEIKEAMDLCLRIRENGITLLIVEHIMEAIMPISDRILVLDAGKKIADGIPELVAEDERVIKAYLGERYNAKNKKS
jgi:branched-chain amino acid transport system ATP-binding protein